VIPAGIGVCGITCGKSASSRSFGKTYPVLDAATGAALSAAVTCAAGITGVTGAGVAEKTAGDA